MANLAASADALATLATSLAKLPSPMDLPQTSLLGAGLAFLIHLNKAKATHTHEELACCLLDDLGVSPNVLGAAFVAPISAHFLIELLPEQGGRLPVCSLPFTCWDSLASCLVYGWALLLALSLAANLQQ